MSDVALLEPTSIPAATELALRNLRTIIDRPGAFSSRDLRETLAPFLQARIERGRAIGVYQTDGSLAGYAAFDQFSFHGEQAAFLPVLGFGVADDKAADLCERLYTALSARWISAGIRKHLISISPDHREVERRLHELGFGRYVVVALRDLASAPPLPLLPIDTTIRTATAPDVPALAALCDESVDWYAAAPIFLRFESIPPEKLTELVDGPGSAIFVAEDRHGLAGFIGISMVREPRTFDCVQTGAATLDGIGAYLTERARRRGIGTHLLSACDDWSRERGCAAIHVDYESANPAARSFWPKYFQRSIYSLMRTLHADSG